MRRGKGKAKKREERQPTDGSKRMKRSRIEKSSSIGSTVCVLILTRNTEWARKDKNIKGKSCQDQMQNKPFAFLFADEMADANRPSGRPRGYCTTVYASVATDFLRWKRLRVRDLLRCFFSGVLPGWPRPREFELDSSSMYLSL